VARGADNPNDGTTPRPIEPAAALAEQQAAAIHAINQRIFETSLDLILVVDRRGTLARVSPSSMNILGYSPDEMAGRSAKEFLYHEDLDNTRAEMRLARHGRQMRNFECRYVHRDGHAVPLAWAGVWSEPEGQYFFIGRDITDRKQAEERLRQSQKMEAIGQLTGGMAHDFNNLLGVIIGNLDLLRSDGELTNRSEELLREAIEAATLGADLTRRLLAFARRQQLEPKPIAINALVAGIVGLLRRTLGEDIPIVVDFDEEVWPIHADPPQLEAALVNLATNARDAMPRGGRLTIATRNRHLDADYAAMHSDLVAQDYAMLEVSDTGDGIAPDVMSRIFEPFFTTKEPGKGSGLGLSMVFGFMKQSGGHINVYSEVGSGTTFRLYLPRYRAIVSAEPVKEPVALGSAGGETILVVEDNRSMRLVVQRQLVALGFRVLAADSAAAALALLANEPIDLLFSDIVMPGEMSGFDLARQVAERWPAVKIVLTSGFPEAKLNGRVGAIGAPVRILTKPYRKDDLARVLSEALGI
jgi:PAS domain S-box-containing protein